MAGVVAVVAVLVMILAWFFWPTRDTAGPARRAERPDVDRAELEAAEREVQDAADEDTVRDWGPGAGKPPVV